MDGWMDGRTDGRMGFGWMDRSMNGRTDGWMDGRANVYSNSICFFVSLFCKSQCLSHRKNRGGPNEAEATFVLTLRHNNSLFLNIDLKVSIILPSNRCERRAFHVSIR